MTAERRETIRHCSARKGFWALGDGRPSATRRKHSKKPAKLQRALDGFCQRSETDIHPGIERTAHTRDGHAVDRGRGAAPGRAARERHGRTLTDVGATQRQAVLLVQGMVEANVKADVLPAVAGAQVEQAVAGRLDLAA